MTQELASHRRSIANWRLIPGEQRKLCLSHLKSTLLVPPEILERWREQKRAGLMIGSDDPQQFHFGVGVAVRNRLRQIFPDRELPEVMFGNRPMRNWDDFYYGAIDELIDQL
jgi:hypothetical protein